MSNLSIKKRIKQNIPGFHHSNRVLKNQKINLVPAKRFSLVYEKDTGGVGTYIISFPIEIKDGHLTVYSFNRHGIRSFKMTNIVSLEEIKD